MKGPDNIKVGNLLKSMLSGSIELGITSLPLVSAYNNARSQEGWKEIGFKEWLQTDPTAGPLLARVFEQVKETLPNDVRSTLIVALGGCPL